MANNENATGEQEVRNRIHNIAIEILKFGNPREFLLNTFKTLHIGDNDTAEGIIIGTMNQSIANSKGIQSSVHGESGYGKSHAARAMLHLHPEKYFMITSLSDKALFYMEAEELRPGITIFSDDSKISEGVEGVIKRSTGFFQEETIHRVPVKERGKLTTKKLSIPPRINWLLTSVDSQGSEQLLNRQISYDVDETAKQDDEVANFELTKALDGRAEFPINEDVLTCREMLLILKEDKHGTQRLFKVKIPFAKRIEWLDKRNRRNLPIFLDMIKGFAALNSAQRPDVDGCVIATEDDFNAAARLYNSRGGFQKLHITEREKEMLQFIVENGGELETSELMRKLGLSRTRVRQLADRLETILPGFYVEKRSENVKETSDDSKSTITQRNYYCYYGAVTVDLFGSIVSLRRATPEQVESEQTQAETGQIQGELQEVERASGFEVEKSQNEEIGVKEDDNNNIINRDILLGIPDTGQNAQECIHVCSRETPAYGHDHHQRDFKNEAIFRSDDLEDSERIQCLGLRLPCRRASSAQKALPPLIRDILVAAKGSSLALDSKEQLAEAAAHKIKRLHTEWRDYDVLGFYKKLEENDTEIRGLVADLTGGT